MKLTISAGDRVIDLDAGNVLLALPMLDQALALVEPSRSAPVGTKTARTLGSRPDDNPEAIRAFDARVAAGREYRLRENVRQGLLQAFLRADPRPECEPHRSLLGAYDRGGLSRRESGAISAHLVGCEPCRSVARNLAAITRMPFESLSQLVDEVVQAQWAIEDMDDIGIFVFLDTNDEETAKRIFALVDDLAENLGLERPDTLLITRGSFLRRSITRLKRSTVAGELCDRLSKLEHAVEIRGLELPQAEVDERLAESFAMVVAGIESLTTACVLLGSLLVLKFERNGQPILLCKNLSTLEMMAVRKYPELQSHPENFFEALTTAVVDLDAEQPQFAPSD